MIREQDVIAGKYYYGEYALVRQLLGSVIVKVKGNASFRGTTLYTGNSTYCTDNRSQIELNVRLATPEEIHWLDKCIQLGTYITKEVAMETFVPEYVKCTNWYGNIYTVGKIYLVSTDNIVPTDINHSGINYINYPNCFELSTEEAYLAQEQSNIVEPAVARSFQIGDTVKIIKNLAHSVNRIGDIGVIEYINSSFSIFRVDVEGRPRISNNQYIGDIELYVEELVQPIVGLSIESILAYCKLKYPIGTQVKTTNGNIDVITEECRINVRSIVAKGTGHYDARSIYYNGKYAEITIESLEPKITSQSTTSTKTYSLEQLQKVLTKEYDSNDVNDILKLIKTI